MLSPRRPSIDLPGWAGALTLLSGIAACSHSQTAPTPVASGTTGGSTSTSSSVASQTAAPWHNPSSTPSPGSVPDLTAPIDIAMVLCASALNLAPCAVVTSSANDTMVCFAGCQTQIETAVAMTIESAAARCAAAPPPEAGPRACELQFPPTAALDPEIVGKTCSSRCEELAAESSSPNRGR